MSLALQLTLATAVIAGLIVLKIVAFRILVGQKPNRAIDVDACKEKDCIGGCGGRD